MTDVRKTHKYNHMVSTFDDLVALVDNIPLQDQKDLAELILYGLYYKGWDVYWTAPDLIVTKTEEL